MPNYKNIYKLNDSNQKTTKRSKRRISPPPNNRRLTNPTSNKSPLKNRRGFKRLLQLPFRFPRIRRRRALSLQILRRNKLRLPTVENLKPPAYNKALPLL